MLPGEALAGHAVRKGLRAVSPRLTQVPHEEGHIGSGVGGTGAQGGGCRQDPRGTITHGLLPNQACWVRPQEDRGATSRQGTSQASPQLDNPNPSRCPRHQLLWQGQLARVFCKGALPRAGPEPPRHLTAVSSPDSRSLAETLPAVPSQSLPAPGWAARPRAAPPPLYLNSFSLFPRRSRTSQWELKASWGGMPQRMMALRKAFRCLALKPSTWAGGDRVGEQRTRR